MPKNNKHLQRAKYNKNDEFYTRMCDIEKEIPLHFENLKNKTIYCCCDDFRISNFVKYFKDHFIEIEIKKLIATNYDNGNGALKYVYDGENETITELQGNGDFLSYECTLIKDNEADIIVTNPPFSKFKIFVQWLFGNNGIFSSEPKQFLVIGNKNAIAWKTIFPLYFNGLINFGYNNINKFISNNEIANLEGIGRWYTNLPLEKKNPPLELVEYNPEIHRKYDTIDIINTNSIKSIPNINTIIGVPIGIIDYICEDQFKIIGMLCRGSGGLDFEHPIIDGKHLYTRILIKKV